MAFFFTSNSTISSPALSPQTAPWGRSQATSTVWLPVPWTQKNSHIPYHPWDLYIYLHEWLIFMVNGQMQVDIQYMDGMGMAPFCYLTYVLLFSSPFSLPERTSETISSSNGFDATRKGLYIIDCFRTCRPSWNMSSLSQPDLFRCFGTPSGRGICLRCGPRIRVDGWII